MLQLLSEGLRETADFRIFEKRYTFKLLLSFYNSDVSDEQCQVIITNLWERNANKTITPNVFFSSAQGVGSRE